MQSCIPEGTEVNSQYSTLQDYEQYPIHFSSSPKNATKTLGLPLPEIGPQYSYHNGSALTGSQVQLPTSSQDIGISGSQDHVPVSFTRYMHAPQYDEMLKYRLTDVPTFAADPHYESDANYELSSASVNSNSFFSKNMLSDMRSNEPKSALSPDFNMKPYDDESVHQNSMDFSLHVKKEDDSMNENLSTGICSTMRWRDPNLSEVISFLDSSNNAIQANAAAYLQHLCYMDDANKQKTRTLGGIPSLIRLLSNDNLDVHKNACGALRNLSYGRQNDENKRAINNAAGIPALVKLLCITQDSGVKELVTGVLWNMSSCEDVKRSIIDESLTTIVRNVIKPHSGWDPVCSGDICYTVVFRNASGVLRNVSSAGMYARTSLRNSKHLVECLLYVIKTAIEENNIGSKTVENCVCTLRNISYRCQEVEDPNYDKQPPVITNRNITSSSKGENLGCFGTSKKKKDFFQPQQDQVMNTLMSSASSTFKGYEILWKPEVVQYYLALLQSCSNPETLEAAAGALQNLSACYWQPSIDIRATVRKEKGLPILVELLRMEVDRVVCAVATALRNLAIDQRNKELIGKYAMRDLIQKLPSGNPQQDQTTSDDTISAVLATINEVIKKNPEFSRSLLDAGGIERLLNITRQWQKYTVCVVKFASQVLLTMWQHHELRDVYKKNGWREQDFLLKSSIAQNMVLNMSNNTNNTLSRPMASQGLTRYEDKTIQRGSTNSKVKNEDIAISHESSMFKHKVDDLVMNVNDETYHQHETETCSTSNFLSSNERA